jgi:uncharacterized protein (TIGR00725 family)
MRYPSPRIAVVGERDATPDLARIAEDVGRELGRRGAIVVCGGMGGVMQAAAKGCSESGGLVVGILPGMDAAEANPYVGLPVVTGMGEGRNIIVVRSAQAVIAIGGSYGTLSEIALALRLGRPVVGLQTWVFYRERSAPDPVHRASDPRHAVELALTAAVRGVGEWRE